MSVQTIINTPGEPPLVSVFIGCYNHSRFVEECLESVRAQTYPRLQVIVFDDCSKDDSVEVIRRWLKKSKVDWQFTPHAKNLGVCASFNECLSLARGKYISMIAADDVWLPEKTAIQVELMEQKPVTAGVVYSDAFQIDEHGTLLPQMFIEAHRSLSEMPQGNVLETMLVKNFVPAMTTLIRRGCYEKVGPYDTNLIFEDWDMWIRISREFDFVFSRSVSAKYRVLESSMMRSRDQEITDAIELMFMKYLRAGWPTGTPRYWGIRAIQKHAEAAYRLGRPGHRKFLAEALSHKFSLGLATMLVLSVFCVPYSWYSGFRRNWKNLTSLFLPAAPDH